MTEREYREWEEAAEAAATIDANLTAILEAYGVPSVHELSHYIYKYIDCGPWLLAHTHDGEKVNAYGLHYPRHGEIRGLQVGSIVEGSDAEVSGRLIDLLAYDSDEEAVEDFNNALIEVNEVVHDLWVEANREYANAGGES
jgi:hypothetical protein